MQFDDHDPELGEQARRGRGAASRRRRLLCPCRRSFRPVAAELQKVPVIERDVTLVGHAAHEPLVERAKRGCVAAGPSTERSARNTCTAAPGKLRLEARLRRQEAPARTRVQCGRGCWGRTSLPSCLGPIRINSHAGVKRPQRLEEGLHTELRGVRATAACMRRPPTRRTPAAFMFCGACCGARVGRAARRA